MIKVYSNGSWHDLHTQKVYTGTAWRKVGQKARFYHNGEWYSVLADYDPDTQTAWQVSFNGVNVISYSFCVTPLSTLTVDWGDGTSQKITGSESVLVSHKYYPEKTTFNIVLTGDYSNIRFGGAKISYTAITDGTGSRYDGYVGYLGKYVTDIFNVPLYIREKLTDCTAMFCGCENVPETSLLAASTGVTPTLADAMFCECLNLTTFPATLMSNVTNGQQMFSQCRLTGTVNVGSDVAPNLQKAYSMFHSAGDETSGFSLTLFSNFDNRTVDFTFAACGARVEIGSQGWPRGTYKMEQAFQFSTVTTAPNWDTSGAIWETTFGCFRDTAIVNKVPAAWR